MPWDIYGHESAQALLQKHSSPEKLRHAYLITGPEGVGRRTLALAFVKALNCSNPPTPGQFCNQCQACRQVDAQNYSDLNVLSPSEGHKDISIDQIREMQKTLALAPYQSRYRVVLILDFQRASLAASNALLKSLEEPPPRAVLILTADAQESLLETISSRCEILRLRPLPIAEAEKCLLDQFDFPAERARFLAHLACGRIGAALRFEQEPELIGSYQAALDSLEELLSASKRQRFAYVESYQRKASRLREQVYELVSAWLSFWRDVMISSSSAAIPLVNVERAELIGQVGRQVSLTVAEKVLTTHEKALDQLDKYVNPRLVLENLLLNLPRVQLHTK